MPTAFLDRDGVINRKLAEGEYVRSWSEFEFLPGVFDALRKLRQHGFRLIVITNQRGISLGKLLEEEVGAIHDRMREELRRAGAALDGIYYCPHDRNSCDCRKPEVGLFLQAQRDFPDIHFPGSYVIGDSLSDMEAAARLECRKVLIAGDATEIVSSLASKNIRVDFAAPSLLEAVERHILCQSEAGVTEK